MSARFKPLFRNTPEDGYSDEYPLTGLRNHITAEHDYYVEIEADTDGDKIDVTLEIRGAESTKFKTYVEERITLPGIIGPFALPSDVLIRGKWASVGLVPAGVNGNLLGS